MKKTIRVIVISVFAAELCFCLCSCSAIDEARKNSAVYDKTHDTICFQNEIFKKVPGGKNIENAIAENELFVSESDVPLLLRASHGYVMFYNNDKSIISDCKNVVYARTDKYEYVKSLVSNAEFDFFCTDEIFNEDSAKKIVL